MIRLLLVLACVVALALALVAMRAGWRNRERRQAYLPDLPAVPADPGPALLAPLSGLYVGTTAATSWQDRIVHGGLGRRSTVRASLHAGGVLLERTGDTPVFIPRELIAGARLAPALAGKVVGAGGLLVITWRLGDTYLDSGVRPDDKPAAADWVSALTGPALLHPSPRPGKDVHS